MVSGQRPAWTRDSQVLRLPSAPVSFDDLSEDWAFGGATGAGVRVAIIDSGIDADHPGLGDCVDEASSVMFTTDADGDVQLIEGPHEDVFGHGTACAGIIHSLAPEAKLTSVRVLGEKLTAKAASFLAALNWAVDGQYEIVSLSLGTGKRDWALPFYDVCDRAYFSNSFLVTAANNMQRNSFPSLYASVTSVACNLSKDPRRFHWNPDPPTEFLAPGIDIDVLWMDGQNSVGTGNSYAAPHISGLAAQIKSKHPGLRPYQVKSVLMAMAANVREASGIEVPGRLSRAMTGIHLRGGTRSIIVGRSRT